MIKGSIVALITPMDAFGEIDYQGLEKLIEFHLSEGTDGLLVLGTTGQSSTLTPEEEEEILRFTVAKVKKESQSSQAQKRTIRKKQLKESNI